MLLTNCKDVVDADENIHKSSVGYHRVLGNQQSGVILPLHPGNKWIYNVTDYDSLGAIKKQYLDSIVVFSDTIINGDKWFKLRFAPNYGENTVIMSNTDVGLWLKEQYCNYMCAPYPSIPEEFVFMRDTLPSRYNNNLGVSIIDTFETISVIDSKISIPITYRDKAYIGVSYFYNVQIPTRPGIFTISSCENIYIPDFGLYRSTLYINQTKTKRYIERTYDLIDCKITR